MIRELKRPRSFYERLFRLTAPIALQNLITFSLGLIDTLMVSQLGNNEMAAVKTANVPVFLLISIVFGVQSGVGILISQYWGKRDHQNISRAIGVAAGLGVGLALVIALALFFWPVQIMDLMSNEHQLSVLGAPYLRIIGFSYVFNMLSSIYVSAQRSVENSGFGMKLFGMSTVLNTGMNYLLIFGKCGFPLLGVEGAAIATLLSRVAEFAVCLVCALRSKTIPLDLKALVRPGGDMLRRFVKYASPVMGNELMWGLGNSLLTVILGHTTVSVAYLAADAVAGNLNRLFLVVCFGLGASTAVMIGKAIGEGADREELMALSRTLSWVTILVGAVLAVVALGLPAGDLPAVQAGGTERPSGHHPDRNRLCLYSPPCLLHLRRYRYTAGGRRRVLVHGAGSGAPVAGGAAFDGAAGSGAGRRSVVYLAGDPDGELRQVPHMSVAHPVKEVDP